MRGMTWPGLGLRERLQAQLQLARGGRFIGVSFTGNQFETAGFELSCFLTAAALLPFLRSVREFVTSGFTLPVQVPPE